MTCASCGHENRAGRRFCVECGAALALACPGCGTPCEPGEKFCGACGADLRGVGVAPAPLPPPPLVPTPPSSARQVVTIVFADLAGSTALHERLDPESVRRFMEGFYQAVRGAIAAHGGTLVKLLGDGVMAAFGIPRVAEDDALRAVRGAVAIQTAFAALAGDQLATLGELGLRVAVNTGEVVVSADDTDVVGDPVNVAARLQQEAGLGEVVIGEATQRLVAAQVTLTPLGRFALKGRAGSVTAWRVASLERPARATAAAFVGREAELARLTAVYDAAVAAPAARLAVLLGSPGLGKSRLIDEFTRRRGETATLLTAHCDAAGGATFAPLAAALRARLGLEDAAGPETLRAAVEDVLAGEDADRARIAGGIAALLAGSPASPEETFFVVRRFLARLAADAPVVLVIDDLHWAEPLLLDLVEHLVQWGAGVPLCVLVGARPELRDLRSTLATPGGLVADVVTLAGLDAGAAMRLAANVIGAADLPAAVAVKVLATSEGNPLFVGELVRMLVQEGALTREGDRWIVGAGLAALEMPPTIHALLAARIERLRPEERQVLERAAVVGRHFSRSAVAALLPRDTADLDARIESLRRGELIERDSGWWLGEPALRFHHVLIRDAAYRRLLKGTRAELHGRLADWIEAQVGDAAEHDETIGWHLEQAHQLLGDLAPLDATGTALGVRAAARLAAAGRRALAADDVPLAASLLGRAMARLAPADPARAELALDWCEALLAAGDVAAGATAIDELGRHAAAENADPLTLTLPLRERESEPAPASAHGSPLPQGEGQGEGIPTASTQFAPAACRRLAAWHTCFAGQLSVLTAPAALQATADALADAAAELTALDDAAGEAKAHSVHAQALARLGRVGACEAALDRALAAARRAGDRRRANAVLAGAPLAALWGPSPVTRASGRCLDVVRVLRITQGAPAVEAVALSCQGVLEALRGRTDAARRMLAAARKMVEELGIAHRLFETDAFAGRIAAMEGDAAAAALLLRGAYDGLRDLGLGIDAARAGALLARVLLAQDRAAEAEALSHESEALAGDDLQAAIAWRGVRAEALARRGEHAAAIELAQAAVAIAAATDALLDHADARLALAAALRAAGHAAEADAEERRAIELWEAKGATLLAERARSAQPVPVGTVPPGSWEVAAPAGPRGEGSVDLLGARRGAAESSSPSQAGALPRLQVGRRVRPNAATESASRFDAAFAASDPRKLDAHFSDNPGLVVIDHPTESTYGSDGAVESYRRLRRMQDPVVRHEPLATLGESLGLFRRHIAVRGSGGRFDVGTFEREEIVLLAPDAIEIFAADHLDQAVAALYARYAALLPDGPARQRAATAARANAIFDGQADPDRIASALAPGFVCADHRSLHLWNARSGAEFITHFRLQDELATRFARRVDDLLALSADLYLARLTYAGAARDGAGAFENVFLCLTVFAAAGLINRIELWEPDREAEALARVDALDPHPAPRRVRANAATQGMAQMEAALAARDGSLLAEVFDDALHVVHHPTRATYGRREMVGVWRSVLKAARFDFRSEILASLGEALALERHVLSLEGLAEAHLEGFGRSEFDEVVVLETDDRGRWLRCEIFAADRFGDAVARLYARHAERLPDGPTRRRAAGVARSVVAWNGPVDLQYLATVYAPSARIADHRLLSTWTAHGADEILGHFRLQLDLAADFAARYEDVLAVATDALVARITFFGAGRDSGGAFENKICVCFTFDADGRVADTQVYEAEQEAAALARFDEVVAGAQRPTPAVRRLRPNAATAVLARMEAAFAAGDLAAIDALLGASMHSVDHINGVAHGREGHLDSSRRMLRLPGLAFHLEPLATLGERLCLLRRRVSASGTGGGTFDVAEYEMEHVGLLELGADGRCQSFETFAPDHLGEAIIRLYERYAESLPEGPARTRAAAAARAIEGGYFGLVDRERLANPFSPAVVWHDHRVAGVGTLHGDTAVLAAVDAFLALVRDARWRFDDVLACSPDVLLIRTTNLGTERTGGGAFERQIHSLWVFDADGRIVRWESFEAEREAEALACFDALTGAAAPAAAGTNEATAIAARVAAAFAAADVDALAALWSEALVVVDHPTGATYGRDGHLDSLQRLLRAEQPRLQVTPLTALGEHLALCRRTCAAAGTSAGSWDVAAWERQEIVLFESDGRGRCRGVEIFADDQGANALARLYARHAALQLDGGARARAAATAHSFAVWLDRAGAGDPSLIASVLAPDFEQVDHRAMGLHSLRGAEAMDEYLAAMADLEEGAARMDDMRCRPDAVLLRYTTSGVGRGGGGTFERHMWVLWQADGDGRIQRNELFDIEQEADALARFNELAAAALEQRFANDATRFVERYPRVWAGRDWHAVAELYAPNCHFDDRRPLLRMQLPRDANLEQLRVLFAVPNSRWTMTSLATRGERLALSRLFFEGEAAEGGGALEIDHLGVCETDGAGHLAAVVLFEPDDEAAWAELDRRYENGSGDTAGWRALRAVHGAVERRDWDASTAAFAPGFAVTDRRRLGWGLTLDSAEMFTQSQRSLAELAPDFRYRFDHVRASERGYLTQLAQVGTRDGGSFESPFVYVATLDAVGRPERFDLWDLDGAGEAVQCYRALVPPPASDGTRRSSVAFTNAASASAEPVVRCLIAHDWEGFRALFAEDFHMSDRRRVVQLELDREQYVAFTREVADGRTVRNRWELVATRGERLALTRACYEFADADVGPSEIAFLLLQEVDAHRRVIAYVRWDVDDLDAAYAELDARWQPGAIAAPLPGAQHVADYQRCFAARDWTAFAACLTPELIARSHRLTGWGTVHGPAALVDTMRVQIDLAPDTRMRMDHVRAGARGALFAYAWLGTHEGGEFENDYLVVAAVDAAGRAHRIDVWEAEQLDQAQARFASLSADAPADALAAIADGHLATVMLDRWRLSTPGVDADWEAMRASLAPGLVFEDRQGFARLAGDRELMIASLRERMASGARAAYRIEGIAGARVAISRMLWSGGPTDGRFEIEYLGVAEVDAAGLVTAIILFPADDGRAARREAWARWAAIEPAVAATVALVGEAEDAFNAHDRGRLLALLADDLVVEDHRRTGMGRIEGAAAYVDSVAVLWDLSPDTRVELGCFWLAADAHGGLYSLRRSGNVAGGGPFESAHFQLIRHALGRMTRIEMFELDQRDAALACWAALASAERPAPSAAIAPPNAASAAMDRWQAAFEAGDWAAVQAFVAPAMMTEDRRKYAQIAFGADTTIADWRAAHAVGGRPQRRLLGTAGERIAVDYVLWSGGPPDGGWEIELLWLVEVGDDGRFTAAIVLDADDARAAQREAWARWVGLDPSVAAMTTAFGEAIDAWNGEDVERLRACFADDLVVEDHRRTGTGRSEGREAYLRSVQALWHLAPGSRFEAGWHWLAIAAQAGVYTARRFGALPDGGAFESVFLGVGVVDRGLTTRIELFEIDAVDAALARFRELTRQPVAGGRPDPLRIPPNAATRAWDRWLELAEAGDWDGVRALYAPEIVLDDRRRLFRLSGGVEMAVATSQHTIGSGAAVTRTLLATPGDRLLLQRCVWSARAGAEVGPFEVDTLEIYVVDAAGRHTASIVFDPEDRAAADAELARRYLDSDAHAMPPAVVEFIRALNAHDLAGVRAALPDDFVLDDRRRTGTGRLAGADAYVAALVAYWQLSPDVRASNLYVVADTPHGRVAVIRASGTLPEGGAFESVFAFVARYRAGRLAVIEMHEAEDLDRVVARFAALDPGDAR